MQRLVLTLLAGVLILAPRLTPAAAAPSGPTESSCRSFVQTFYNGYVRRFSQTNRAPLKNAPVNYQPAALSAELRQRLREDYAAAEKSPGEIVGLDFDPILNAQDIAERFEAGAVRRKGRSYLVEVFGLWGGKKNKKPDVVPELVFQNGRWVFVNFHYGVGGKPSERDDLLHILRQLREDRRKHPK